MSKVTISETTYKNFGRCVQITNGIVKLLVTVDVGPRVINYSFVDGENMMREDIDRKTHEFGPAFDRFGGGEWFIYGGHRLWASPEAMPKSYYPDNDPVPYTCIENGAIFTPDVQKWNQYQFSYEITLSPDSTDVTILHKITNHAAWAVELAPWALTVLSPGGTEVVPMPVKDTGLLGNRLLALWPYTRMNDPRVTWGERFIILRQDPSQNRKFKLGINSEHGYAMYFNHGDVFIKQFSPKEDGCYPDGGMSFETFTDPNILEMETLGELVKIEPDETIEHVERWSLAKEELLPADEDAIEALAAKYVK